jgi:hypothetical protein
MNRHVSLSLSFGRFSPPYPFSLTTCCAAANNQRIQADPILLGLAEEGMQGSSHSTQQK